MPSSDISKLTNYILEFREKRDWKQFHNPKDIALSMMLEVSELAEHFQWKNKEEIDKHIKSHREEIGEELADVLYWVLILFHDLNIHVVDAFEKKMKKNELKYPVEKAKGKHVKYNKL